MRFGLPKNTKLYLLFNVQNNLLTGRDIVMYDVNYVDSIGPTNYKI